MATIADRGRRKDHVQSEQHVSSNMTHQSKGWDKNRDQEARLSDKILLRNTLPKRGRKVLLEKKTVRASSERIFAVLTESVIVGITPAANASR